MTLRADLPDLDTLNHEALKALIITQHEQLTSRDEEIERLKLLIAKVRRMEFGRKSEKLDWEIEQSPEVSEKTNQNWQRRAAL